MQQQIKIQSQDLLSLDSSMHSQYPLRKQLAFGTRNVLNFQHLLAGWMMII